MTIPTTTGQIWPNGGGSGFYPTALDDLTDVDTTTVTPASGDVLYYDGSVWRPATIVTDGVDPLLDGSGNVIYT